MDDTKFFGLCDIAHSIKFFLNVYFFYKTL
jgi:hypothetical protein